MKAKKLLALVLILCLLLCTVSAVQTIAFAADPAEGFIRVDDSDTDMIEYHGKSWVQLSENFGDFNNTMHRNNVEEAYLIFTAVATEIKIGVRTGGSGGYCDIYLDNELMETDCSTWASARKPQTVIWESGELAGGAHSVKVVCKGTGKTNSLIMFDFIDYKPYDLDSAGLSEVEKQIASLGWADYSTAADIKAARAAYDALSADEQAAVSNYDLLEEKEAYLAADYAAYKARWEAWAEGKTWTMNNSGKLPWMNAGNISAENMQATADAIADEAYFEYVKNAYNVGIKERFTFDTYSGALYILGDAEVSDHIGDPWDNNDTRVGFLQAPFPGMAFSVQGYMSVANDRAYPALSNAFVHNGRVYQQFLGFYASYDASAAVTGSTSKEDAGYAAGNDMYPGVGLELKDQAAFRYTYAKYNQDNKWDGRIFGVPDGAVTTVNNYSYQTFSVNSDKNILLNTADRMANIPADTGAADYLEAVIDNTSFAITGSLAAGFAALTVSELAELGDYISHDADSVTFANGVVTADGIMMQEAPSLFTVTCSDGVAVKDADKYNITWNAGVELKDGVTLEDINAKATFKSYGVYYGISEAEINKLQSGEETAGARKMAFAEGEDIDVYTVFGFRLKGVAEGRDRAAEFYVTYEVDGKTYTEYSSCETAAATE